MPASDINLADRSGGLVESQKGYQPRIVFFYFIIGLLFSILAGGLAYRQIVQRGLYSERERVQNQRQVVTPGPRGNILDREGRVLAGSKPQVSVVILLDELRAEFGREARIIHRNYAKAIEADVIDMTVPGWDKINGIARATVLQRYLDQLNRITGRSLQVDQKELEKHFLTKRLLPYVLEPDLDPSDYARLLEQLPVDSKLQIFPTNARIYPYGSAAAHTIGSVETDKSIEVEYLPYDDLTTFKMEGIKGRDGLEAKFDPMLQGKASYQRFTVDPKGYKIDRLDFHEAKQGEPLVTSLDIDLQLAAEESIGDRPGAAVALDVNTGEVLVLANYPGYDLNAISPRISNARFAEIEADGAWLNQAVNGLYPPGSTFKILDSIAALRRGSITPSLAIANCTGEVFIGGKRFVCDNGRGQHGWVTLAEAIARSCDVYFFKVGELTTQDGIAAEGRRFNMDHKTGIELPFETSGMVIPDRAWKRRALSESWYDGDTANMSIGQGYVLVTPLEMATFVASVARNEVSTKPTLLHKENAPTQHSESIGLNPLQRAALIEGMEGTIAYGTAKNLSSAAYQIPGVRIAGKTGTAQKDVTIKGKRGTINFAWFICFAPVEKPEIAIAVMLESEDLNITYSGGANAAPVASAILKKYFEKKARSSATALVPRVN